MDEGIAVLIAAAMAILGILYSSRQQRKLLRKQHTYQVLDKMNDWPKFEADLDFASALIKEKRIPRICDEAHKKDCERIDFLLNQYEFLSAAIISGDMDEGLVRGVEESRLTRIFLKFIDYIQENREDRDTLIMWENVEFMCYRWKVARPDPFEALFDRLLIRLAMTDFRHRRSEIWGALIEQSKKIK